MSNDNSWRDGHLNADSIESNIEDFCNEVDQKIEDGEFVQNKSGKWFIVISGSSAFIAYGVSERYRTDDIDICELETYQQINDLFKEYDMNTSQMKFPNCFPSDYHKRWELYYSGLYIDIYIPSWSDLTFAKLQRYKYQDQLDLDGLVKSNELDWEEVESLIIQEENGNDFPKGIMEDIRWNWNRFLERHKDKHDLPIDWGAADPYDGWDD